jgi:PAS domain S-box-containing protein
MPQEAPPAMEKAEYISDQLLRLTHYWIGVILAVGAFLFLLFGVVDYFVTPEYFNGFFLLRAAVAATLALLAALNRASGGDRITRARLYAVILAAAVVSAAVIEAMILKLGGHESYYYAGLSLVVISALGIVPLSVAISVICVGLIYAIYLVPIILLDSITNVSVFVSNNAFLLSTFVIALVWRSLEQKNLIKTLGLQYELDKDKKQLELYSTRLEHLVEARTRKLNKSELMFRSLFEHANDGIMITDREGTIVNVNRKASEIHGFDENALKGTSITLLETEENKPLFRERMRRILMGESLLFETRHYRKDGSRVSLEVSSRAIEVEGRTLIQSFQRDITEKKRLEQQILHSQKMDSIGLLAGGIAHDFNNILTSILGFAELMMLDDDLGEYASRHSRNIENAARQATQMVSKLLSFARRSSFEPVPFSVNSVMDDTLDMVARLIPKEIRLKREFLEVSPVVEGDPSQLEQVIMNLVLNARDAMPDGGKIVVSSRLVVLGPTDLKVDADVVPGEYVSIVVSDTGVGIPEENLSHIFEPFYTTKEKGKGTGLGLAMLYGIVREHKGYVTVRSRVGSGTAFTVYLPVSDRTSFVRESGAEAAARGNETILAIDDEKHILEFIRETLEGRGFSVITTDDPVNGMRLYRSDPEKFDLVITDILMPAMDGTRLIDFIRKIRPEAKVVAATAFSEDIGVVKADALLRKPFSGSKLLMTIRDALDHPARH